MKTKPHSLFFNLSVFLSGALFSIGLYTSSMVDPIKVKAFLDISGNWDPSLALVMLGALVVFSIGYSLLIKPKLAQNSPPIFSDKFHLPSVKNVDPSLIIGAVLFGAGWGLVGLCPGPVIANLIHLDPKVIVFFITMLLGMKIAGTITAK